MELFFVFNIEPECTPHNDLRMPNVVIDQSYHPETENSTESNGEKDVESKIER